MIVAPNMLSLVGKTPMVKLNRLADKLFASVYVKLEFFNPMASVKDRAALAMIEDAEKKKLIDRNSVIIEPSSGNTGIALAFICAVKGYKLIVVIPESMSIERRHIITALGATIEITPAAGGMKGAIERAREMAAAMPGSFIPFQFSNKANPRMHYNTTAQEIWEQTEGSVDIFVAGVGTGGTISGVGKALKLKNDSIRIVAVEPEDSPVLSGGTPAPHKIQGIGAGFIPENVNMKVIDSIITVSNTDAIETAKLLMRNEGIFGGISSGANVHAALTLARKRENKGKLIVTVICDTAERYLSTALFDTH